MSKQGDAIRRSVRLRNARWEVTREAEIKSAVTINVILTEREWMMRKGMTAKEANQYILTGARFQA